MNSNLENPTHKVVQYPYNIRAQKEFILLKIRDQKKISFEQMVAFNPEKIAIIYNFLAVLELLQLQQITLYLGEGYNNFWIERIEKELAD